MSEADIDKTLADSFPASDPPSWTLGTNRGSAKEEKKSSRSTGRARIPRSDSA